MLRSLTLLLVAFVLFRPAQGQESRTVTERFPVDGRGEVTVDTYKGAVEVTAWDRDEVEIVARIEADGTEGLVADTDIHMSRRGNAIHIETDYDRAKRRNRGLFGTRNVSLPFVYYTIRVPRETVLEIEDYKSIIDVAGLEGDVDLETYKGEVRLSDIRGDVRLETYKGDVAIRNLAGSLDAETYRGRIDAAFDALLGDTSFDTYRGDVRITLPPDAGFSIDADLGRNGDLTGNVPLETARRDRESYRGDINGGGPRVRFETYRGTLDVRSR